MARLDAAYNEAQAAAAAAGGARALGGVALQKGDAIWGWGLGGPRQLGEEVNFGFRAQGAHGSWERKSTLSERHLEVWPDSTEM